MKILVAGFAKIKYMPYANFYLDNIDTKQNEVHFVYWNRDLREENLSQYKDITLHEFRCYQEDNVLQSKKIVSFLKYRQYVMQLLKKNKFDFVFVLHSMAGILLQDVWTRKFKERYIFDYRDSTYERFSFFKRMIAGLISHSKATFTSSDGFRELFPREQSHKIHTTHNVLADSLQHRDLEHAFSDKLRVSFWGLIREEMLNQKIIEKFAGDSRFELHYFGREQALVTRLKEYTKSIKAENIFFHGEYIPSQRYEFAVNTELIHNIYNSNNMMRAMGNKYYDGAIFRIPQLCMKGSFMGRLAKKSGIGLPCDPWAEDFTEKIYQYYMGLDKKAFADACDRETDRFMEEYHAAVQVIADCLQESR